MSDGRTAMYTEGKDDALRMVPPGEEIVPNTARSTARRSTRLFSTNQARSRPTSTWLKRRRNRLDPCAEPPSEQTQRFLKAAIALASATNSTIQGIRIGDDGTMTHVGTVVQTNLPMQTETKKRCKYSTIMMSKEIRSRARTMSKSLAAEIFPNTSKLGGLM